MAMEGPLARRVSADQKTQPFAALNIESVFIGTERTLAVFQLAPESVEMNRVFHHRVVHQDDSYALSELQADRLGVAEFLAVKAPYAAFHVASQMDLDVAIRRPRISSTVNRAQAGVGKY